MKKFLSILLTLSIICSLIVVPAMSVSAAEIVLFKEAETAVVVDQDFSKWNADADLATNSATGTGSITDVISTSGGTYTDYVYSIEEDGALKVTMNYPSNISRPSVLLKINPDKVDNTAKEISTTFKIKQDIYDDSGELITDSLDYGQQWIAFGNYVELDDGSTAILKAGRMTNTETFYGFTSYKVGNQTIAGGYGCNTGGNYQTGVTPKVDSNGYLNLELRSYYKNGNYYSELYDLQNNGALVKGVYCSKTSAGVNHNMVGAYIDCYLYGTTYRGYKSEVYIKDVETTYSYDAIGSVTTNYSTCVYDEATDTYTTVNTAGCNGTDNSWTKLVSNETLTTGRVVIDFEMKNEEETVNETHTSKDTRKVIKTGSGNHLWQIQSSLEPMAGAFNQANGCYSVYNNSFCTSATETAKYPIKLTPTADGWSSIRIVATCSEESGTWSYAFYDRNNEKYGIETPIFIKRTTETTFTGIRMARYLSANSRAACTTEGLTSLPRVSVPVTFRDFNMVKTDVYDDYTYYTTAANIGGTKYSGMSVVDGTSIKYNCMLYTQRDTGVKLVLAAYDADGNEIASTTKELGAGLYEYYDSNPLTLTVPDSSQVDSAKVFVYDGNEWITEEYILADTSFEREAEYGYAAKNDELRTLRFYFTPSFKTTMDVTNFGAYIVPLGIFDEGDVTSSSAELVSGNDAIESGETFAVELNGVPTEYEDVTVIGIPFIAIDGEYVWGDRFDVVPASLLQ